MAVYEYKGLNESGKNIKGIIDADSLRSARNKLKSRSIYPTEIKEGKEKNNIQSEGISFSLSSNRVSLNDLSIATRQLSTLVGAGIPLVESLRALREQLDNDRLKRVFSLVCDNVNEGSTLADALKNHEKVFPPLYINMVASAEASGTLDVVMDRLADLLESQAALKQKLIAASVYPVLMLALCFIVILVLLAYVVPQITEIFADQGQALPLPTEIVIALSNFVQNYWWLIMMMILVCISTYRWYAKTEKGRLKIDTYKLKLPFFGLMNIKIATGRMSRTLGTMLGSGVELLTSLAIVKNIVGNVVLEKVIENTIEGVKEGRTLASELDKPGIFPKLLIHLVGIGEKTGQLEQMLLRTANTYDAEINTIVSSFTKILEPVLILLIAVIVGGILAAVMLPMLEMSSLAL